MTASVLSILMLLVPPQSGVIGDFTDSDLAEWVRTKPRVLFYSVTPAMPLSVEGIRDAQQAAEALRAEVVFLLDPSASGEAMMDAARGAGITGIPILYQKSAQLRDHGIQLHYPSMVLADAGKVAGPPIPGYKNAGAYAALIAERLGLSFKEAFQMRAAVPVPLAINAFFKPLYGTDYIVGGRGADGYLLNLKTGNAIRIPNGDWSDPGTSLDGEFITLLGHSGLAWYSTADILAGRVLRLAKDAGLTTYQSMGTLPGSGSYRVLGAVSSSLDPAGLIVRDHVRTMRQDGGANIQPVGPWAPVCGGRQIAIPMLSKKGFLLSGIEAGTLKVFRIGEDAKTCEPVFDTKKTTGKADFSADDRLLAFVSRAEHPETKQTVDTVFVADLPNDRLEPIYYGDEDSQLEFPGFISEGRLVVYEKNKERILTLERVRTVFD